MSFADLEAGRGGRMVAMNGGGGGSASQEVAKGVFQITTAVSTFHRLVNTLGTPKDTPQLREKLHKTRLHISQLVKDTSAKLKQASEAAYSSEASDSNTIADAKLAKEFQAVLKEFQKVQRTAAEKETAYAPFVPSCCPSYEVSLAVDVVVELLHHYTTWHMLYLIPSIYTVSETNVSPNKTPEERTLLMVTNRQDVIQLENEIMFNETIIEERDHGIRDIQNQIGEVNEIFKDLAVLVHKQGIMIDDVDANIDNSEAATAQAKSQLVKASKLQRSNSSLSCLLLVIFGIVLLIVTIVLTS